METFGRVEDLVKRIAESPDSDICPILKYKISEYNGEGENLLKVDYGYEIDKDGQILSIPHISVNNFKNRSSVLKYIKEHQAEFEKLLSQAFKREISVLKRKASFD